MPPDEVRAELAKILASDAFVNAGRLSRFLRFVVERTLAGESDQIKEYLIGVEVFDRGTNFDPRVDPVVRVEARRLRAKLTEYYETAGASGAVKIGLRKGSYVPLFQAVSQTHDPPALSWPFPLGWRVAAFLVVAAAVAGAYWIATHDSAPLLAVMPMAAGPEQTSATRQLANGIAEGLTAELSRNAGVRVTAWPSIVEYLERHPEGGLRAAGLAFGADYVVAISVHPAGERARVLAHLVDPARDGKIWAADYERSITGDLLSTEREISRAMAEEIRSRLDRAR